MERILTRKALVAGLTGLAALAALSAVSARTLSNSDRDQAHAEASAEELYAQAPAGVDPMVTGPVSQEFRQKQKRLGCDTAQWPNVPLGCYPN